MSYHEFLTRKAPAIPVSGIVPDELHPSLFPFQRGIVDLSVRRGRAAIFADCGMGKTRMQLEWARHSGSRALIVCPLAVGPQTQAEANAMGLSTRIVARSTNEPGIDITNYEKLHHFDPTHYDAIVLDESSILKSYEGKVRTQLIEDFGRIPARLCCTATPAPNDIAELANHAEFLGIMSRVEMLATFFVHDDQGWRLKGHAQRRFYEWMAGWSVYVRKPSDCGCEDEGFVLPDLSIEGITVNAIVPREDGLLFGDASGIGGRLKARRASLTERLNAVANLIDTRPGQWLVWVGLNDEGRDLKRALGDDAVLIEGADDDDDKIARERSWRNGEVRTLITKPSMFGFGMNWQHCHQMAFMGLGDSYEQYYQAIRRCWRFGQKKRVTAAIVVSNAEGVVVANVRNKEAMAAHTADEVIKIMKDTQTAEVHGAHARKSEYVTDERRGDGWRMLLGDCVERMREIETGTVGLSVFSPPFASLYTYSASDRDMGNSKDYSEFFDHFRHMIPELQRVTMPGRRACVHVQQVSTTMVTHGVIGWRDFRADMVREFVAAGWVYDGEVVIDKDPQAQAIRTKSKALMFVQKERDSSWSRPAMADYILLFRHPGENPEPIKNDVTNEEWICWARPIWYGIDETDTLNAAVARVNEDERHICPLQLGTIDRCVRLWSNKGDLVLSPFGGIGSEGVGALKRNRRFVGIELKPEYWRVACRNLDNATKQLDLFAQK